MKRMSYDLVRDILFMLLLPANLVIVMPYYLGIVTPIPEVTELYEIGVNLLFDALLLVALWAVSAVIWNAHVETMKDINDNRS